MNDPIPKEQPSRTPNHRPHQGRCWVRLLAFSSILIVVLAILYDLYPSLVLPRRVDLFMDIVKRGETRTRAEAELEAHGFEVPHWPPAQQTPTEIYQIRSREPYLSRVSDGIALSLGYDDWWAGQKRPHFAIVSYDELGRIENIEFGSEFNPLWY